MALARCRLVVQDEAGNIINGASVEVRREVFGQPLVQAYSDRAGTVALGNPFVAADGADAGFHVVGGAYQVRVYTGPSGTPTWERIARYVAVGTAGEFDVNFDGSVLEVQSFWPQHVVQLIADRAAYDAGPVFDDQGRRLSVLVTADATNLDDDLNPLPTLYFLLEVGSPSVWSDGFTFPVMVPELADGVFTGDGATTVFNLGVMVQDARYVDWYEDGIPQRAGIDFTTSGTILTRTTAPADGAIIWWKRVVVNDITGMGAALDAKLNKSGTTTNDNAAAGDVGEYISASVEVGSALSRTTAVAANITSIALTAGDWDVTAIAEFNTAATTLVIYLDASISQTSNTRNETAGSMGRFRVQGASGSALLAGYPGPSLTIPSVRVSLAANATLYLVTYQEFSTSTMTAWGTIHARRVR